MHALGICFACTDCLPQELQRVESRLLPRREKRALLLELWVSSKTQCHYVHRGREDGGQGHVAREFAERVRRGRGERQVQICLNHNRHWCGVM